MATYIMTRSRKRFDLETVNVQAVDLDDIAYALAHINRYTGHVGTYCVLEHSIHVTECALDLAAGQVGAQEAARESICHDMAEAYTGDVSTPVKRLLGERFLELESRVDRAIRAKFKLATPSAYSRQVMHKADRMVTHAEALHFLGHEAQDWAVNPWSGFRPFGRWRRYKRVDEFLDLCKSLGVHA